MAFIMNDYRMAHFRLTIRAACLHPDVSWHLNNNEGEVAEERLTGRELSLRGICVTRVPISRHV